MFQNFLDLEGDAPEFLDPAVSKGLPTPRRMPPRRESDAANQENLASFALQLMESAYETDSAATDSPRTNMPTSGRPRAGSSTGDDVTPPRKSSLGALRAERLIRRRFSGFSSGSSTESSTPVTEEGSSELYSSTGSLPTGDSPTGTPEKGGRERSKSSAKRLSGRPPEKTIPVLPPKASSLKYETPQQEETELPPMPPAHLEVLMAKYGIVPGDECMQLDDSASGNIWVGRCTLDRLVRTMALMMFANNSAQASYFVLTYDYFTDADTLLYAMNDIFFEGTDNRNLRPGIVLLLARFADLNPEGVTSSRNFPALVHAFYKAADPNPQLSIAFWHLFDLLSSTHMIRNDLPALAAEIKNEQYGLICPYHSSLDYFTGKDCLDWFKSFMSMNDEDTKEILTCMLREDYVRNMFDTQPFVRSQFYFPSKPLGKKYLSILDFSPKRIAEQLCLKEHTLFCAVRPKELYRCAWSKKTKAETSPNVGAMIRFSNMISFWIISEFLSQQDIKKRVEILQRAISIAHHCYQFNNFNAMSEVLLGLEHTSVRKLRRTWLQLNYSYRKQLLELSTLMSSDKNSIAYRNAMKQRLDSVTQNGEHFPGITGVVPRFGNYLSDITFIDTANKDFAGNLINFKKMRMLGNVLYEIAIFQRYTQYNFKKNDDILDYFNHEMLHIMDENDMYKTAVVLEEQERQLETTATS